MLSSAKRRGIVTTVICGCSIYAGCVAASGVTLRVATYGGAYMAVMQKYAAAMFERQTGDKVEFIPGNPSDQLGKMVLSKRHRSGAPFDVAILDSSVQAQAVGAGVLSKKYSLANIPNLRYLVGLAKPHGAYGPALDLWSLGLAYNKKELKKAGIAVPSRWKALWNPKLKGHVAIPDLSVIMGRDFAILMAKHSGGGEGNLRPGLKRIARLKDVSSYYTSSATLTTELLSGNVWVAPWTNGRAWGMIDSGDPIGFVVPKSGTTAGIDTINIVKGTKHPKLAQEFVNDALSPLAELGMAHRLPYGPTNKLLWPVLKAQPKLSRKFPWSKSDLKKLYKPKWSTFNKHINNYTRIWNEMVLH